MPPIFTRAVELRMAEQGDEVDTVLVALPGDERPPQIGAVYDHPDMGDLIVVNGWPAGQLPKYLNDLSFDAPPGSMVFRMRRP
jgi:hypothetical protein